VASSAFTTRPEGWPLAVTIAQMREPRDITGTLRAETDIIVMPDANPDGTNTGSSVWRRE
jgi:hypothetical protein